MLDQPMLECLGRNSVYTMSTKNTSVTRQGVRNLDSIPSKSRGIKLDVPPKNQFCKHTNTRKLGSGLGSGYIECLDCGIMWDWDGQEI